MQKRWIFLLLFLIFTVVFVWFRFLAPVQSKAPFEIVSFENDTPKSLIAVKLKEKGIIRSITVLEFILKQDSYSAGGYEVSKSMNVLEIAALLDKGPGFRWVLIVPGLRKEQIAEKLAAKFNWKQKDINEFLSYPEGNYYPDTYLIPATESGELVGKRMINRFNEVFAPLASQFLKQNIKNDTAIKIASLIQREAAGSSDMPLIAGVIWNRLLKGMLLQLDASNQYVKGRSGDWWPVVKPVDLHQNSAYNLYLNKGLPPTPIASPGLEAIKAVLNPQETDCFYYLHDHNKQIHCSVTYEEHLANIKKYL